MNIRPKLKELKNKDYKEYANYYFFYKLNVKMQYLQQLINKKENYTYNEKDYILTNNYCLCKKTIKTKSYKELEEIVSYFENKYKDILANYNDKIDYCLYLLNLDLNF